MTSKLAVIHFNSDAGRITISLILHVITAVVSLSLFGVSFTSYFSSPLTVALVLITGGLAGLKSSRMFGGRRNFTGRLTFYFSLALFAMAFTPVSIALRLLTGSDPMAGQLISSLFFVIAQIVSSYALLVSVRAVFDKVDMRTLLIVLSSLLFGVAVGFTALTGFHYIYSEQFLFLAAGLWPALLSVQLASALLLISQLGKWYATKAIGIVAFGYLGFSVLVPAAFILSIFLHLSDETLNLVVASIVAPTLYTVGFGLSQVRPRVTKKEATIGS